MEVGIFPPLNPVTSNPAWVRAFALSIEAAGCESLWSGEHPLFAPEYEHLYPYSEDGVAPFTETTMPDPLEFLSFVAGVTTTLKVGTGVLLLPLHSPAIVAKRLATLDTLSGGRFLFGIGLGWQREEFIAGNVPYGERAARMDELVVALRALWTQSPARFEGKFYQFPAVHCDPKPTRPGGLPIIIGGSTEAAARRAGRYGDGFFPYVLSPDDMASRVALIRQTAIETGRDPDAIELTANPTSWKQGAAFDVGLARAFAQLGATRLVVGSHEAESIDPKDIGRFIAKYRDQVLARI